MKAERTVLSKNLGPGGCVPWDDFAEWLKRMDVHLTAANYAANQFEDESAPNLRPLWGSLDSLRVNIDFAAVACGVDLVAGDE